MWKFIFSLVVQNEILINFHSCKGEGNTCCEDKIGHLIPQSNIHSSSHIRWAMWMYYISLQRKNINLKHQQVSYILGHLSKNYSSALKDQKGFFSHSWMTRIFHIRACILIISVVSLQAFVYKELKTFGCCLHFISSGSFSLLLILHCTRNHFKKDKKTLLMNAKRPNFTGKLRKWAELHMV